MTFDQFFRYVFLPAVLLIATPCLVVQIKRFWDDLGSGR